MLIFPLILTQTLSWVLICLNRTPCIPTALLCKRQLPLFTVQDCTSEWVCICPLQRSDSVSDPIMSLWSQWDHNSTTACRSVTLLLSCPSLHVCVGTSEGYHIILISQRRYENFLSYAVVWILPYLGTYTWGESPSALFCWIGDRSCAHDPVAFACQLGPPFPQLILCHHPPPAFLLV